jgi:hypothetical protein
MLEKYFSVRGKYFPGLEGYGKAGALLLTRRSPETSPNKGDLLLMRQRPETSTGKGIKDRICRLPRYFDGLQQLFVSSLYISYLCSPKTIHKNIYR